MIENLVCFKLNNMDRKVLLYTYNEPYNGMNEYLKIYALELDNNDNIVHKNMNEEVHSQVKNAIAMMGKNQADSLTILPIPQINIGTTIGKAFAIPTIFKNGIREVANRKLQAVSDVSPNNVIENITKDNSNGDIENVPVNNYSGNENIEIKENDNTKQESTDALNNVSTETTTESTEPALPFNYYENDQPQDTIVSKNEILNNEEYNPMEQFVANDVNNNILIDKNNEEEKVVTDNEDLNIDSDVPSISEVESALNVIIKYVKSIKKDYNDRKESSVDSANLNSFDSLIADSTNVGLESNNSSSNEIASTEDKDKSLLTPQEFVSTDFSNEPLFPDDELDIFNNEPTTEKEKNGYVAVQNVGQTPINNGVYTENRVDEKIEPVVMPDNFIGNQDSKFEITGLGPSTLSANEPQMKYVA